MTLTTSRITGDPITYERLEKVLLALGFTRKDVQGFITYKHLNHEALIVLPGMPPDARVSSSHFIAVRNTIIGRGIASASKVEQLFQQPNGVTGRKRAVAKHAGGNGALAGTGAGGGVTIKRRTGSRREKLVKTGVAPTQ